MSEELYELIPIRYSIKYRFNISRRNTILIRHGHIAITNYKLGDNWEFEKSLSIWDKINFKYRLIGGHYVKKLKEFRINRAYDMSKLRTFFPYHMYEVDNDHYEYDTTSSKLLVGPRDDFQRVALSAILGKGVYENNEKYSQRLLDMDTGAGKTYCGIAASAYYKSKLLIIVPISKLIEQWKESIITFTNIPAEKVVVIQGGKKCDKLYNGEYDDASVFIVMVDTIMSYHKKYGDLMTIDLLAATKAYVKIVDEVHSDIKAISVIEALSNFKQNYYMSASPGRSDNKENFIFNTLFKSMPKFGSEYKRPDENHITVIIKKYSWIPNTKQVRKIINIRTGMNTKSYETQLMNADIVSRKSFEDAFTTILKWVKSTIKEGKRVLILAHTIEFLSYLENIVTSVFEPCETGLYYGGMNKKDKPKVLDSKIIIATTSSLGTGADIPNIQHVINCSTYSNKIGAIQLPGRARKLKDGTAVTYIELVNTGYQQTYKQYNARYKWLVSKAKDNRVLIVE